FELGPAEVAAPGCACREQVDLLEAALADVGDPEVTGRAVEGETPRVAYAVVEDLRQTGLARERVACGREVGLVRVDVEAQDLSEERRRVEAVADLSVAVVAAAFVTHRDVEVAVGTERE